MFHELGLVGRWRLIHQALSFSISYIQNFCTYKKERRPGKKIKSKTSSHAGSWTRASWVKESQVSLPLDHVGLLYNWLCRDLYKFIY